MGNYDAIPAEEIKEAFDSDPQRGALMLLANAENRSAREKAAGKAHKPKMHEEGFHLSIKTSNGVVGLWSCWLKDKFHLCYPKSAAISDALVAEALGLDIAAGALRTKRWGSMHSEAREGEGRVWASHCDFDSYGRHFHTYDKLSKTFEGVYYGHDESMSVNAWASYKSEDPDDATWNREWLQEYRDPFIRLALAIAKKIGDIESVVIQYAFTVLIPEQLEALGYTDIAHLPKKTPGAHYTVISAKKTDSERIVLESANSLVPWVNYRCLDADNSLSLEQLKAWLVF